MFASSIASVLAAYGFVTRADGSMSWGIGSLVWGHSALVRSLGDNRYSVTIGEWFYTPDGEEAANSSQTYMLYGAQALELIFSALPLWR